MAKPKEILFTDELEICYIYYKYNDKKGSEVKLMKSFQTLKFFIVGAAMMMGIFLSPSVVDAAADMEITVPTERAIYQRDNANAAQINISVEYDGEANIQAQLLQDNEAMCDWISLTQGDGTTYTGVIPNIPGGGWYQLSVKAYDKATGAELASSTVEKVGVGEVFITGGQSNSCNFGGAKTTAKEDIVSAFNVNTRKWQHCEDSQPSNSGFNTGNEGGSPWPSMGDALVAKIGVPVGFVSTGVGSAKIEELRTKHYFAIKDAITYLKPYGYRAFLLHQGEADTPGTNRADYLKSLEELIAQTRRDAGYDLNWVVAQVSYAWSNYNDTKKMESMKETQRAACNDYNIFVGPTTDDLQGDYRRRQDNLHLSELGLIEHGKRWAEVVYEKMISKYEVTCDASMQNGKFVLDGTSYNAGDVVKLTAVPADGYYLKMGSLKVNGQRGAIDGTSFIMHAEKAVISAEFVTYSELVNALKSDITEAESMDLELYDDTSKAALTGVLQEAKQVRDNPSAAAEELQKSSAAILSAKEALVLKEVAAPSPTPSNSPTPTSVPTPSNPPLISNTPEPSSTPSNGQELYVTPIPSDAPDVTPVLPKKGTVIKKGVLQYTITSSTKKVKTVSVRMLTNKKKTSVTIPKTVSYQGYTYKVTEIGKKAFYKAKKLKKVKIHSTTIKKVGKNAFKNVHSKIKIRVPAKKLKAYQKLLKGKGLKRTAQITKLS